jgi:autotransporter translocation and assembly factor TamB
MLLLCLFTSTAYFVINTEEGSRLFMVDILPKWVDGYQIGDFSGKLSDMVYFKQVHIQNSSYEFSAEDIEASWDILPILKGKVALKTLSLNHFKLKTSDADLETEGSIDLDGLNLDDINFDTLSLPEPKLHIKKLLPITVQKLTLLDGKIRDQKFKFNINSLTAHQVDFGTLTFQSMDFSAKPGHIRIESKAENFQISWSLDIKSLGYYIPSLAGNLKTEGTAYLHKHNLSHTKTTFSIKSDLISYQNHSVTGLALEGSPLENNHQLRVVYSYQGKPIKGTIQTKMHGKSIEAQLIDFKKISGKLSLEFKKKIQAKWHLAFSGKNDMKGVASITPKMPFNLSGEVLITFNDLNFVSEYTNTLKDIKGEASTTILLSGTVLQPNVISTTLGQQIAFRLPQSGTMVRIEKLEIRGVGQSAFDMRANGTVGDGPFTLTGTGAFQAGEPKLALRFQGNQIVVSNSPEYFIVINPNLTLTLESGKTLLSGEVTIPEAKIQPAQKKGHVGRSGDIIFISNESKIKKDFKLNDAISSNITFKLGEKVTFQGFGLKSKIIGEVIVTKKKNKTPRARGTLQIKNGKYTTHNRTLNIAYGRIMFTGGPITQPLLDIRGEKKITQRNQAHKKINDLTVGLHLKGPLHAFKLVPFSNPALPESEVISYLALGQAGNQGGIPGTILLDSASQISQLLGHNDSLNYDILSKLKLDIGINGPTTQTKTGGSPFEETAITIGKQISQKLYINYSVGILDSASQVGLRYLLGKNVSLEAQTGAKGSGADLLITLEGN